MSEPARLLAVGGAHVDRRGQVAGAYVPAASNPGTMREEIGGGAFNAARMAVRRGVRGAMFSLRGGDAAGAMVAEAIAAAGLDDLSAVFLDRRTPSYTALLEADGDLVAGLADMSLYEFGFEKQMRRRKTREAIAAADAVLTDANLTADALARLAAETRQRQRRIFAIAVSPAKVVRLRPVLGQLDCLFMNRREAAALGAGAELDGADLVSALKALGLSSAMVTAGDGDLLAFDAQGAFALTPPRLKTVADVTGAGDALAGAAIAAMMAATPFREAARQGLAAAALAVATHEASPHFTQEAFAAALALVGEPRLVA